jgi:hypothetical protein
MNKTLTSLFFSVLIFSAKGQAHLGASSDSIYNLYPEKKWSMGYTNNGTRWISGDMPYGTFFYYFDKETKLSNYCIQLPFDLGKLNGQVESYNKKYVITSDTSWTAYLVEGGIIYIKLLYDEKLKASYFSYKNAK